MGFYITAMKSNSMDDYIGSQTTYSLAEVGAFDCKLPKILEDYCNVNENVIAMVDGKNINDFIRVVESCSCSGRDVVKMLSLVKEKYKNVFMGYTMIFNVIF